MENKRSGNRSGINETKFDQKCVTDNSASRLGCATLFTQQHKDTLAREQLVQPLTAARYSYNIYKISLLTTSIHTFSTPSTLTTISILTTVSAVSTPSTITIVNSKYS